MSIMNEENMIDSYGKFIGVTIGSSMLPIIESGVNSVELVEIPETVTLKRLDIILYKSDDENVKLSRIVRMNKNKIYLCGDNEYLLETIDRSNVIAICIAIKQEFEIEESKRRIDVNSFKFKWYSFWKVAHRPYRRLKSYMNNKK